MASRTLLVVWGALAPQHTGAADDVVAIDPADSVAARAAFYTYLHCPVWRELALVHANQPVPPRPWPRRRDRCALWDRGVEPDDILTWWNEADTTH